MRASDTWAAHTTSQPNLRRMVARRLRLDMLLTTSRTFFLGPVTTTADAAMCVLGDRGRGPAARFWRGLQCLGKTPVVGPIAKAQRGGLRCVFGCKQYTPVLQEQFR